MSGRPAGGAITVRTEDSSQDRAADDYRIANPYRGHYMREKNKPTKPPGIQDAYAIMEDIKKKAPLSNAGEADKKPSRAEKSKDRPGPG